MGHLQRTFQNRLGDADIYFATTDISDASRPVGTLCQRARIEAQKTHRLGQTGHAPPKFSIFDIHNLVSC